MNAPARITPVILSGGAGKRLWPLSRLGRTKQFVSLGGEGSLLRQTAARVADGSRFATPIVVAAEEDAEAIEAGLAGICTARLILEPCPRGTAAAVALAALDAADEELLLVLPSDHAIGDSAAFLAAIERAAPAAADGWLVTFGIRPDRPETGYGYIKRGRALADGLFEAAGFVEKPPYEMAETFLADGGYDWNGGIFLFRAGAMVEALAAHAPEVLAGVRAALASAGAEGARLKPDGHAFATVPAASIDRAVMEKSERVAIVPVEMGWSDVGSWDAVHALGPLDASGNLLAGDVVVPDSRNCLVRSDGPVVVALGVEDLIVVATERAVLVVRRGESQRVTEALDALEARRTKAGRLNQEKERVVPERRPLGRSGLSTPRLVLGGNVFGWTADKETSFRLLDRFVDAGGILIDTADVYSAWVPGHKGGESETIIGEWLRQRGSKGDVQVATKVGMMPGEGGEKLEPARIASAAEASLRRLGVETIDLYYAHQEDPNTPLEDSLAAFDRLVKAGKVRAIGASNYSAESLQRALDISEQQGLARYEVVQPEYNLVARDKFEGPLQRVCVDNGLGVLPYYGLASGFLTGKYRSPADYGKSVRGDRMAKYLEGNGRSVLAAMDEIAADTGATLAQIALAWVAAQPGITAPIASATSLEQLDDLIGAMSLELSEDQLRRLDEASREVEAA